MREIQLEQALQPLHSIQESTAVDLQLLGGLYSIKPVLNIALQSGIKIRLMGLIILTDLQNFRRADQLQRELAIGLLQNIIKNDIREVTNPEICLRTGGKIQRDKRLLVIAPKRLEAVENIADTGAQIIVAQIIHAFIEDFLNGGIGQIQI